MTGPSISAKLRREQTDSMAVPPAPFSVCELNCSGCEWKGEWRGKLLKTIVFSIGKNEILK